MSTSPAVPVAGTPAPAPKLTAIQILESELMKFFQQKEQAIANVHAVEGAIQAGQHLLNKLKAAAAEAEAEAKKLYAEAGTEVKTLVAEVEAEAKKL